MLIRVKEALSMDIMKQAALPGGEVVRPVDVDRTVEREGLRKGQPRCCEVAELVMDVVLARATTVWSLVP